MRDEVSEAIQTEDGYEITYHLEHCPQCNAGGIEAGFSLLSLLGCTLQDVHFIEKDGSDIVASISELNANMIPSKDVRNGQTFFPRGRKDLQSSRSDHDRA